jgi:hypothetical protein
MARNIISGGGMNVIVSMAAVRRRRLWHSVSSKLTGDAVVIGVCFERRGSK